MNTDKLYMLFIPFIILLFVSLCYFIVGTKQMSSFWFHIEEYTGMNYNEIKDFAINNIKLNESLLIQNAEAAFNGNENVYDKTENNIPFTYTILNEEQLALVSNNKWHYEIKINNPPDKIKEYILKYKDDDIIGKDIRDIFKWINIDPVIIKSVNSRIEFDKRYLRVYIISADFENFNFVLETEPFVFSDSTLWNGRQNRQVVMYFPSDKKCDWCMKSSLFGFEIIN